MRDTDPWSADPGTDVRMGPVGSRGHHDQPVEWARTHASGAGGGFATAAWCSSIWGCEHISSDVSSSGGLPDRHHPRSVRWVPWIGVRCGRGSVAGVRSAPVHDSLRSAVRAASLDRHGSSPMGFTAQQMASFLPEHRAGARRRKDWVPMAAHDARSADGPRHDAGASNRPTRDTAMGPDWGRVPSAVIFGWKPWRVPEPGKSDIFSPNGSVADRSCRPISVPRCSAAVCQPLPG